MKIVSAAAHQRHGFVQPDVRLAGQGSGVSAEPHKWRDLLDPVVQAKDALGLNPTDLSVLRTILSFIPYDHLSLKRPDGHICFAQNTTIAHRLGRSGDSTVNRAVRRLEEAGLITRCYSSNRKRYARRSGSGAITHAYGIDVSPLIVSRAKIEKLATTAQDILERLSCLREDCKAVIAKLQQRLLSLTDTVSHHFLVGIEDARRILRRKPAEDALTSLKADLEALLTCSAVKPDQPDVESDQRQPNQQSGATANLSNGNGQSEQHKESETNNPSVSKSNKQITFEDLESSFPKMMAFLRTSKDLDDFHSRADTLAFSLGDTTNAWRETKHALGFHVALLLLGYLVQNHDRISNHGGYLRVLASKVKTGDLTLSRLLQLNGRSTEPKENWL